MFLPLEAEDLVSLRHVVALIRNGNRTEILLRDRSVVVSHLTPLTLTRRARQLWNRGREERDALRARLAAANPP